MALRSVVLCFCLLANFSSVQSDGSVDQGGEKATMRKERVSENVEQDTKAIGDLHEDDGADLHEEDGAELNEEERNLAEEDGSAEAGSAEEEGEEGEADEDDEGEEEMGEDDEDSDIHYVPHKSLIELEKMHEHGNGTKESILALISDDHEQSLPDDEVMVPVRLEGHTEHFPTALEQMEPSAFLEGVMKGRNLPDLKPIQLMELRQESDSDDGEEGEEDEEGDDELAEDEDSQEGGEAEESDDGIEEDEESADPAPDDADASTGDIDAESETAATGEETVKAVTA